MIIPRAQARIFMAGHVRQDGNHTCASCGREYAYKQAKKALSSAFNQTEFFLFPGMYLCDGCLKLFGDKDGRSKCLFYPAPGEKKVIDREEVLPLLEAPPQKPFVLSVPYSFKKHHWLFAGLSGYPHVMVGTDDRSVELDYGKYDIPGAIHIIGGMLVYGVPRSEVATGTYSVLTRSRYGAMLDAIKKVRGYVVLSGYENELYADELAGWHMETRPHHNFTNRETKECLWVSPRTWEALQREREPGMLRLEDVS